MSDRDMSSAAQDIRVTPGARKRSFKPNELVAGMTKDTRKRWLMVLGGVSVVIVGTTMLTKNPSPSSIPTKGPVSAVVDTSPKGLSNQNDWRAQTSAEVSDLKRQLAEQKTLAQETNAAILTLSKQLSAQPKPGATSATSSAPRVDLNLPPPPTPPRNLTPPPAVTIAPSVPPSSPQPSNLAAPAPAPAAAPVRSAARAFVPVSAPTAMAKGPNTAIEQMVPNERKGFLPGGSFADATLISGVEAFTGGTAQSQPQPLIVRLDKNAVLPNSANYDIKGCHVLVSAWGDLSSERVYARLVTLTCVDAKDRLVLSEEVEGVLVDSDGKNGIRGSLQDRQGAKLARSLLAGFAQGVASAFGAAQSTVSNTALGTTSSILSKDAPRAGAYQGASTAAEQLADFYLKQAESTMPVIAVDAGRKVSVLFTKSKALKFETTDAYRPEVKTKLHVERKVD